MKILITGHTAGIGKYLFEYYKKEGNAVVGISRSTGYNINDDQDIIEKLANNCDLFINNANSGAAQRELLIKLNKNVKKIISIGSVTTNYSKFLKNIDKEELEETHNYLCLDPNSSKLLLLKPSFIENSSTDCINSDYTISYQDILNSINFWFKNPNITKIEYACKLTAHTIDSLNKHGVDTTKLQTRINNV